MSETARARFDQLLTIAGQRLDASDLLAGAPHRAESIQLLLRASNALEECISQLKEALPGDARWEVVVPEASLRALASMRQQLERTPQLDAQLSREDLRHWRAARRHLQRLRAQLLAITRSHRTRLARKAGLAALVFGAVALVLAAGAIRSRLHDRVEAKASDFYGSDRPPSQFLPEKAIDADPATEWLTPEGKNGWFELDFARPTNLTALNIRNARNLPYRDRGVKSLEVQVFRGDHLVKRANVEFEPLESAEATAEVPIVAADVTRVRLVIGAHYGKSAGLAEVQVIEKSNPR